MHTLSCSWVSRCCPFPRSHPSGCTASSLAMLQGRPVSPGIGWEGCCTCMQHEDMKTLMHATAGIDNIYIYCSNISENDAQCVTLIPNIFELHLRSTWCSSTQASVLPAVGKSNVFLLFPQWNAGFLTTAFANPAISSLLWGASSRCGCSNIQSTARRAGQDIFHILSL